MTRRRPRAAPADPDPRRGHPRRRRHAGRRPAAATTCCCSRRVGMFLVGLGTFVMLLKDGLGLAGYSPPVFWIGLHHHVRVLGRHRARGTLISAILFLFRSPVAHGGVPLDRGDDGVRRHDRGALPDHPHRPAVDLLLAAALSRTSGSSGPTSSRRCIWDVFAISTYFTVSTTFLVVGLVPDVAAVRDKVTGWRKKVYALASLGWTGTDNQWRHYTRGYLYLAALATPLVLSVHSVVSWDFAMSIVPGLARDDLRTLLRGRRHLLGHRDGAHAAHPAPEGAQAGAHDHRVPLRQPGQADALHGVHPVLRLR